MSDPFRSRTPQASTPAAGAGIALVAVAVVLGALLIWKGPSSTGVSVAGPVITAPVTAKPTTGGVTGGVTTAPPTPVTKVASAALKVTVVNASGQNGVAGKVATALKGKGYPLAAAVNREPKGGDPKTQVYFQAGYQVDAQAVAVASGLQPSVVVAQPTSLPVKAADIAPVVVLLGQDYKG